MVVNQKDYHQHLEHTLLVWIFTIHRFPAHARVDGVGNTDASHVIKTAPNLFEFDCY